VAAPRSIFRGAAARTSADVPSGSRAPLRRGDAAARATADGDVDQVPVKDYAATLGISASNAGVRVFRAREALRKQVARSCGTCADHGCLDCSCGGPA
jgi:hypothetical protein